MKTKYTPATWRATARRVTAPETEERLGLDVQINGGNRDDNKANARLIAAAPELLAAVEMIRDADNDAGSDGLHRIPAAARAAIDAAIAKATGAA